MLKREEYGTGYKFVRVWCFLVGHSNRVVTLLTEETDKFPVNSFNLCDRCGEVEPIIEHCVNEC